jgi:hypothetical protein
LTRSSVLVSLNADNMGRNQRGWFCRLGHCRSWKSQLFDSYSCVQIEHRTRQMRANGWFPRRCVFSIKTWPL